MRSWDENQERKLVFAILKQYPPPPIDWKIIADQMGDGFTVEAARSVLPLTLPLS